MGVVGWRCFKWAVLVGAVTALLLTRHAVTPRLGSVAEAVCRQRPVAAHHTSGSGGANVNGSVPSQQHYVTTGVDDDGNGDGDGDGDAHAVWRLSFSSPLVSAEYADMNEPMPVMNKPAELPRTQQINITSQRLPGTSVYVCEYHNLYYNVHERKFYSHGQEMTCVSGVGVGGSAAVGSASVVAGGGSSLDSSRSRSFVPDDAVFPLLWSALNVSGVSSSSVGYVWTPVYYDAGLYSNMFHGLAEHLFNRFTTIAQLQGRLYTIQKHRITIMENPTQPAIQGYSDSGRNYAFPPFARIHEAAFGKSDTLSHEALTNAYPQTWLLCRHVYYTRSFKQSGPFRIAYTGRDYGYLPERTLFPEFLSPPSTMSRWHLRFAEYVARSLGFPSNFDPDLQPDYITIINRARTRILTNAQPLQDALKLAIDSQRHHVRFRPIQDWPNDPKEAIHLARTSQIIIGAHGAGSTYVGFMRAGSYYLEILAWRCDFLSTMYGTLASRAGVMAESWSPPLPTASVIPPPPCDYNANVTLHIPSIVHLVQHYLERQVYFTPAHTRHAWATMTAQLQVS